MKLIISTLILLFAVYNLHAQDLPNKEENIYNLMERLKGEFKTTTNDSLFIATNSDGSARKVFLTRGDLSEDVEEAIYAAKPGQVTGPFNAGTHMYLFKNIRLDSMRNRWLVNHIFIKPKGFEPADTLAAYNLGLKLAKELYKRGNFSEILKNNGDDFKSYAPKVKMGKNPGTEGASGWIWEGTTLPQFDKVLLKARKNEAVVAISPVGVHVFQVTEKQMGHFKAQVYMLMKKVQN